MTACVVRSGSTCSFVSLLVTLAVTGIKKRIGSLMYRNIISVSLLFAFLGISPANSAELKVYKFFEFGAIATDNLQLVNEDEELIFSVKPSVELSFEGNRFDSDLVAGIEAFSFTERGDTIVDPRLELSTEGALINNLVFVNASLEVGRLLEGEDFFDLTEDSDTRGRLKVNPFISRKFGRSIDFFLGYGHQSLDNEFDGDIDAQLDTLSFTLGRDPQLGGVIWGIGADFEQDRSDDLVFDSFSTYASIGSTVGQTVFWQVLGGVEFNDFTELQSGDDEDGSELLEVSLNWTPTERTRLKVGYSERFFGGGPILSFQQRLRNSTIFASWTREVSNSDVNLSGVTTFTEPTDDQPVTPSDVTDLNNDNIDSNALFVDERFIFGYKLAGRRSDLTVDAIFSDQEEILGSATNDRFVSRIAFDRHLSPLTTLRFQYEYLNERENGEDREDENRLGVRFIYNFDRKARGSILPEDSDE